MTPAELMYAARCYRCIPPGLQPATVIWLLSAWAAHTEPEPPVELRVKWEPTTAAASWAASGAGSGNCAAFNSTVDPADVVSLDLSGKGITSITGLDLLTDPSLILDVSGNPLLAKLEITTPCAPRQLIISNDTGLTVFTLDKTTHLINFLMANIGWDTGFVNQALGYVDYNGGVNNGGYVDYTGNAAATKLIGAPWRDLIEAVPPWTLDGP